MVAAIAAGIVHSIQRLPTRGPPQRGCCDDRQELDQDGGAQDRASPPRALAHPRQDRQGEQADRDGIDVAVAANSHTESGFHA